jgi:HEPN domain-containing protein
MLAKARADLSAARLLATHDDQDDGIIGFHAQQACEKSLKAVLAVSGVDIPLSHNLPYLIELVEPAVRGVPDPVAGVGWLNPWAVTMRYQVPAASLDREAAVAGAAATVEWAATIVGAHSS